MADVSWLEAGFSILGGLGGQNMAGERLASIVLPGRASVNRPRQRVVLMFGAGLMLLSGTWKAYHPATV
jgi:hypothetical protein